MCLNNNHENALFGKKSSISVCKLSQIMQIIAQYIIQVHISLIYNKESEGKSLIIWQFWTCYLSLSLK